MAQKRPRPVPSPRKDPPQFQRKTTKVGEIVVVIIAGLVALLLFYFVAEWAMAHEDPEYYSIENYTWQKPTTYVYTQKSNDEVIWVYVIVDPQTNIEYLVTDRGGITPRLGV